MTQAQHEKPNILYRQVRSDGGIFVEMLRDGQYQRIAYCPRPQQKPTTQPRLHYH